MTDPTRGDVDMVGDLFHPGHVDLLRAAGALGDQLVVGVRSDETCAAYKRRPIMTLDERVAVIEACRYVDEVIPDSPFRLTMDFLEEHDLSLVVHGDDLNADGVADVYGPVSEAGQVCSGSSRAGAGSPQPASWRGYVTKARPLTSRQRARPTWPRRRALRLTRSTSSGFGATRWHQTGSQRRFDSAAWTQPP